MSSTLLDAIHANPDDDAPRLVYADWLQERGDPRGELIQVQCSLARLANDDDDDDDGGKRRKLKRRERELLDAHATAWLEPVRGLGLDDSAWTFVRGFPSRVYLGPDAMPRLHGKPIPPLVDDLDIGLDTPVDGIALAASPLARQARRLSLRTGGRRLGDGHFFAALPRLRVVELEGVRLTSTDMVHLVALPQLEELTIRMCRLLKGAMDPLAGARCRLRRFVLPTYHLGLPLARVLVKGHAIDGVRDLRIPGHELGGGALRALVEGADLSRVVDLDLRSNELGAADLPALFGLKKLRRLWLGGNAIRDQGLARLLHWPGAARLTKLHLGGTGLTRAGARALAASKRLSRLTSLVLSDTKLDAKTEQALLDSEHLAKARLYVGTRFLKRA